MEEEYERKEEMNIEKMEKTENSSRKKGLMPKKGSRGQNPGRLTDNKRRD